MLTFPTQVAAMGSFSRVQPLVGLQGVHVAQRLPAVAAEEASAPVRDHVPTEVRHLREAAVALAAGKRLLPAVSPQMGVQVP